MPIQVQTMSTIGSDLRKTFKDVSWTYHSAKKNRRFKHQSITISLQRYTALAAALTAALATALADAALGTAHAAAVSSLASLACRVGKGYERLEESRRGTGHLVQIKNLRGRVAIRQLSYPCLWSCDTKTKIMDLISHFESLWTGVTYPNKYKDRICTLIFFNQNYIILEPDSFRIRSLNYLG